MLNLLTWVQYVILIKSESKIKKNTFIGIKAKLIDLETIKQILYYTGSSLFSETADFLVIIDMFF